jgi:CRISPR-associated endonuclease/helicase Cas3
MTEAKPSALQDNPYFLWAKLPGKDNHSRSFHPLLCHMLDVAVVAREIWRAVLPEAASQKLAAALRLSPEAAQRWITYLAALHDLGKASPAFQMRKEAQRLLMLYQAFGSPPNVEASECPHGRVTAGELPEILASAFGMQQATADRLAVVIGGHHGTFPTSFEIEKQPTAGVGKGKWKQLRHELAAILAELLEVQEGEIPAACDHAAAMAIAGLVSVADWIGSNNEFFPYLVCNIDSWPTISPADYLQEAESKARKALQRLGWIGWIQPTKVLSFAQLFPFITGCRPLQDAAIAIATKLTQPGIVIIEAPMGEGKTEAALYLADHWGMAPGPRGCYVALPTQATSNQMFSRVHSFLEARYPGDKVNLQLLHGHAALSAEFQILREYGDRAFVPQGVYGQDECGTHGTSVVAAEWFTHRKRGLLAPFGVGTVDQALLAVLQTRHVFVRLFGLAHKVVILDEVHAYDAYMSKLMERLLEWLAALGSPVVLLSATLPDQRRKALLEAYRRGLQSPLSEEQKVSLEASYPRITWADATSCGAQQIAVSVQAERTLKIEWIDGRLPQNEADGFTLSEKLKAVLRQGGCAAVICNTVNRAQQVYLALKPYFAAAELDLLHARFLFRDRSEREKNALVNFGKEGEIIRFDEGDARKVSRPHLKVLVATQVIEQSLDLDFDLMVTDLAPVDLILQRSGRLHRHERTRPASLSQPTLWICQPEEVSDDVPVFDRGTEAVYDAHILLRSWLVLRTRGAISIPDEIEELIESVYGEVCCPETASSNLRAAWNKTLEQRIKDIQNEEEEAKNRWLKHPQFSGAVWRLTAEPKDEDAPDFHQAHQALTRLAADSVNVVFLYEKSGQLFLDEDRKHRTELPEEIPIQSVKMLLANSVSISSRAVIYQLKALPIPSSWQKNALLRQCRLLTLHEAGFVPVDHHTIRLSAELGVLIERNN